MKAFDDTIVEGPSSESKRAILVDVFESRRQQMQSSSYDFLTESPIISSTPDQHQDGSPALRYKLGSPSSSDNSR